ncbi:fumarylacetoacetate hydrolase family protein [Propylenella binzhouense]|uniref:FAA hydrolase family protein n=1 Tax=Propylenella binzhouense TaxID=2555902 RepID=A0A964T9V9_9HYPH|nr:fumarylacetoacetate hydrolase family protein [Propylenella binzhouense]MYZ50459.1 FAA hydrolase family protein [Propylenella binzhouense]
MKLATISVGGRPTPAVALGSGRFVDLSREGGLPSTLLGLVRGWDAHRGAVERLVAAGTAEIGPEGVRVLAPIPRPERNIMCVGKNYYDHAHEFHGSGFDSSGGAQAVPEVPVIFTKAPSAVIGPGEPIPAWRDPTGTLDYEVELAVVIGRGGSGISKADAYGHVFGYTILNDATARALQRKHQQWFLGKSIDGFCPMGPAIVTADEIPDVAAMRVSTRVNGELRQDARVADLIFDIPTLIETISALVTLEPGDIIATGTPAGVGLGFDPPKYLKPGDVVTLEITGLGTLENPVGGRPA